MLSGVSAPSSALWPATNRKPRLEHLQWGMGFGSTFDKRGFYPGKLRRMVPDGETPLSKCAATPGTGAVLMLSGVLALGGVGKPRNMGNVSSCCINAKRGFRFGAGCGIQHAGETPLRTFAAGRVGLPSRVCLADMKLDWWGPGGRRKATGCNREAWGREITTINYTNACAIILEECYQVAANMKQ